MKAENLSAAAVLAFKNSYAALVRENVSACLLATDDLDTHGLLHPKQRMGCVRVVLDDIPPFCSLAALAVAPTHKKLSCEVEQALTKSARGFQPTFAPRQPRT